MGIETEINVSNDGLADIVSDGINDGDKLITCCGNSEGLSDI